MEADNTLGEKTISRTNHSIVPLTIDPIKPGYEQIADQLRELVMAGKLKINERLPSEAELGTLFGVSRSTIREALRLLSSLNLVVTTRGVSGGSFIAHPEPRQVREYLEGTLGLLAGTGAFNIETVLEARLLLETPAAGLAAKNRTPEQLEKLNALMDFDPETADGGEIFATNWDFHLFIFEATGNKLFDVMARPLTTILRSRFTRENVSRGYWRQVLNDHQKIFEAINDGDSMVAENEMRSHLSFLSAVYRQADRFQNI